MLLNKNKLLETVPCEVMILKNDWNIDQKCLAVAQVEVEAHYEVGWYWLTEVGSRISLVEAGGNMTDMKTQPRGLLSQDDPFSQVWWPSSLSVVTIMFYCEYKLPCSG